jgi:nucleoredoxin
MVNALVVPIALFVSASRRGITTQLQAASMSSLSSLLDANGEELSGAVLQSKLANKRVALYFAAGWCPMCTSFEPDLIKFQKDAAERGMPIEIVYISSDRSSADLAKRASSMNMMSVPFDAADDFKRKFNIWAGSESAKFGFDRRSGVPAIVVLDKNAEEMAFVAAESEGVKSLDTWPLHDDLGIW